MEPFDTYEHAGMTVELHYDEGAQSPREDMTNLGVMFCDYRGYDLGDEDAPDPREQTAECDKCDGSGESEHWVVGIHATAERLAVGSQEDAQDFLDALPDVETGRYYIEPIACDQCDGDGEVELSLVGYLKREHDARVILPLFVYDHSGITMRAGGRLDTGEDNLRSTGRFMADSAGWDTSTVGVIFDTAETRKECGCEDFTDEQLVEALQGEVATYATYIEGGAYGYVIKFPDGEEYDSCWGFFDDYGRDAANDAAELGARELEERREASLIRGEN